MTVSHVSIFSKKGTLHTGAGGVASYTKNLISHTPYQENDVVNIFCDKYNGKDNYREKFYLVNRCFNKDLRYVYQILKEIHKSETDLIHVQHELKLFGDLITTVFFPVLIFMLKVFVRKPILVTLHGVVSLKKIDKEFVEDNFVNLPTFLVRYSFYLLYKLIITLSDHIIVHEEIFKDILIDEYGIDKEKVKVIHHGVEERHTFNKDFARKKLGFKETNNVILFMGYLVGYKGLDLLIDGFACFLKDNPNSLLVIGAGKHPKLKTSESYIEEYYETERYARKNLPERNFIWEGFIKEKNIPVFFSAADLTVFPYKVQMSSSGPMSISIGYGVPFIASDVFQEVFSEEVLFKRNPESLAKKLSEFFNKRSYFVEYIRGLKESRSWPVIGKNTYNFYKEIMYDK